MRFEKVKKNALEADMMKWIKSTAYIDLVDKDVEITAWMPLPEPARG